jgi:hypothetical protein
MENEIKSDESHPSFRWSAYSVLLMAIGSLGAYFLLTRHYAHVLDALPFLLLLACPLMHVFMHQGHGGHADNGSSEIKAKETP